jgi:hypothetical protein
MSSIDNTYSLNNLENYYEDLTVNVVDIVNKYIEINIEYLNFIIENIKIKNKKYVKFVIIRGIQTITHVFMHILYYTKNLNLTYFYCQKAFYFYVEFVSQITEEQNIYLQLSSRDATSYVYKKTIFEINQKIKKTLEKPSDESCDKLELINKYIEIYKIIMNKFINNINFDFLNNTFSDINKNNEFIKNTWNNIFVKNFEKIYNKINYAELKIYEVKNFLLLIEKIDNKIDDNERFTEILLSFIKKINKNSKILINIENKLFDENMDLLLEGNLDKLLVWLFDT